MRTLIIALLLLTSCAPSKPPFMEVGPPVVAPAGAVEFCMRHPVDELCA